MSVSTEVNPRLAALTAAGTSVWLDQIRRSLIENGELQRLIDVDCLRGVTSNPSIFEKAILGSDDYDGELREMAREGLEAHEIYDRIAIKDVQLATDVLRPVWDSLDHVDGFVSLEVQPELARDTDGTLESARSYWSRVDRPNLFIKIPGTVAGVPAIEELLVDGININITLLFSVERYEAVARAYLMALASRAAAGQPIDRIASVASFFLSRIDVLVDELLEQRPKTEEPDPESLLGKVALANAKLAYQSFKRLFAGPQWDSLKTRGARVQRLLWASTGTKNPDYPELMYVAPLIGPMTVNTMPLNTIEGFLDHGMVRDTIEVGVDDSRHVMADLERLGIHFTAAATQLEDEGIEKFIEPFDQLLHHIETKRRG